MNRTERERALKHFQHWAKRLTNSGIRIAKDFGDDDAAIVMLMRAAVEHGKARGCTGVELMGRFAQVLEGAMPGTIPQASLRSEYDALMRDGQPEYDA